ncbi:hypothetical protein N865_16155 [Intrasporangium oryzae NRRL B-24470]|uniref:Uncharacterized protein n=1 Tax=Intrasporangium oryzae NRRL B-24470 TaxID=1386089 RepID=W9G2X2_9MICO|nr:DUF4439 domain-containing protein [Intrasporangium oryzae]EWT00350.1 hypothetical protein N865_16155 [Intrasporangium oryzae NRRL B-24470]
MDGDTQGLAGRVSAALGQTPRRVVLTGLGAAALAVLVDRGLRLDLPQPTPPVPTRRLATDERILLPVIAELRELVAADHAVAAGRPKTSVPARLERVQAEQLHVLTGRLTNQGVPTEVIDAATPRPATPSSGRTGASATASTPSSTKPAPSSSPPPRTTGELARRLDTLTTADWRAAALATPPTRGLLSAAYGVRLAGVLLLGREVPLDATASLARPAMAAATLPLVYAFEVVAAQSTGGQRTAATTTLESLRTLARAVSGPGTADPGGWALPYPVTSPADARRLATDVLRTAVASHVDVAGPRPSAGTLEDVVRWSAHIQALATEWRVPLTPFPGAEA